MAKPKNPKAQPPPAEESKGLIARAVDAIDHVIHPDASPKSEPEMVQSSEGEAPLRAGDEPAKPEAPAKTYREHQAAWPSKKERGQKVSHRCPTEESDLKQHPKFDKFKKGSV